MAKRNVIKSAKSNLIIGIIVILVLGWVVSIVGINRKSDLSLQNELLAEAELLLQDEIYVRAAQKYVEALKYKTENNSKIEEKLLQIYKDGEMVEEYYAMIEERINSKKAKEEEYLDIANSMVQVGGISQAISYLVAGEEAYPDNQQMVDLLESIQYEYSEKTLEYNTVQLYEKSSYSPAFDGRKWGYISSSGDHVLDFIYDEAFAFSDGYAVVKENGTYLLIDQKAYRNAVDKNELDQVASYCKNWIVGVKDGKYGIYSKFFEPILEAKYDNIYIGSYGSFFVQQDEKWAIFDENFEQVTDFIYYDVVPDQNKFVFSDDGFAMVADEKGYYLIREDGTACFEERFSNAKGYVHGRIAVSDENGAWGFINGSGEVVIDFQYEDAYSFTGKLAAVKYAGKWGFINKYNTMVIENDYSSVTPFMGDSALVWDGLGMLHMLTLRYYELFN